MMSESKKHSDIGLDLDALEVWASEPGDEALVLEYPQAKALIAAARERDALVKERDEFGFERKDGCTHYCEEGHFSGDDMVMVDIQRLAEKERADALREALESIRDTGCQAATWYDLPGRWLVCMDPEYCEDEPTEPCPPCKARAALSQP